MSEDSEPSVSKSSQMLLSQPYSLPLISRKTLINKELRENMSIKSGRFPALQAFKHYRPCFVADNKLRYYLSRYHGKEEISTAKSQHSIYQQGFGMIFCNPGPIAASCYLAKEVVAAAIQAFVSAVWDLTQLGMLKFSVEL